MPTYDLFGKRDKPLPDVFQYDRLPEKFRRQVLFILKDSLDKFYPNRFDADTFEPYAEICDIVCREYGLLYLNANQQRDNYEDQVKACIIESPDIDIVLAVIESATRLIGFCQHSSTDGRYQGCGDDKAIEELNHRFRENGIGYTFDPNALAIIRIDNLFTHAAIIQPALSLLSHADYSTANSEFISALDDYKAGTYAESITKAGSAYESVMKIICKTNGWTHDPTKPASHLVSVIINEAKLEGSWQQVLLSAANVRNLKGSAHGRAHDPTKAEEHHCVITLNLAASCMVYLVEEFG